MNNRFLIIVAVVTVACALSPAILCAAPPYTKAAIWYVRPQERAATPRTIADVQAAKTFYLETQNSTRIEDIADSLRVQSLHCDRHGKRGDIWLVAELITKTGARELYAADNKRLFTDDGTCSRRIDKAFRKRFNFLNECFTHCREPALSSTHSRSRRRK